MKPVHVRPITLLCMVGFLKKKLAQIIIRMQNYFKIQPCITKLRLSADCDLDQFDLATCFFFTTHRLVMMIICAKLFSDPIMYC